MQTQISKKMRPSLIIGILLISSASALLFNYLNPKGLTIISASQSDEGISDNSKIEFFKPINIETADAYLLFTKNLQFIDVRYPAEYRTGHIPNSMNLPFEKIKDARAILEHIPPETPLVIYGNKTDERINNIAAEEIFRAGYKKVYIYRGGIDEWIESSYQVIR